MVIMVIGNHIEMYSTHNEVIQVERIFSVFKNRIYKYMTSISRNVYIDKLTDIINECNNAYHNTMKMNPADVQPAEYVY